MLLVFRHLKESFLIRPALFFPLRSEIRRQNAAVQPQSPVVPRQFQLDSDFIVDLPETIMPDLLVVETAESSPLEFKFK